MTVHKAQGLSVDVSLVLARGDEGREWTYTAMSRGREENLYYTPDGPPVPDEHGRHLHEERPDELAERLERSWERSGASDSHSRLRAHRRAADRTRKAWERDLRHREQGHLLGLRHREPGPTTSPAHALPVDHDGLDLVTTSTTSSLKSCHRESVGRARYDGADAADAAAAGRPPGERRAENATTPHQRSYPATNDKGRSDPGATEGDADARGGVFGPAEEAPLLLTVRDVEQQLQLGRTRTHELLRCDEIPVIRIGRVVRVPRDALLQWIDAHTT